jgi:hypothetical protein
VVRRWYATSDASLLADDVLWRVLPAWPAGSEYRGRRAVVDAFFPALRARFAAYAAEPTELLEATARDAAADAAGEATVVDEALERLLVHHPLDALPRGARPVGRQLRHGLVGRGDRHAALPHALDRGRVGRRRG